MGGSDKGSRAVEKIMNQPVAPLDVRFGSKADIGLCAAHVRFDLKRTSGNSRYPASRFGRGQVAAGVIDM
jgi:hypothetical protein